MAKVLAEQVDESVTAGMNTFFAEFASCLTELQTRLRESLALRQQNESVVRLMQQQLQQTVMTHGWIYTELSCYAMIFKHFSRQNDIDQDVTGRPRSRAGVGSSALFSGSGAGR